MRSRLLSLAITAGLVLALVPGAASADHKPSHAPPGQAKKGASQLRPTDYTKVKGLSQPRFPETVREAFEVPTFDGEYIYVEVERPDPATYGDLRLPVIAEISPYHGTLADRKGIRIFPDPQDAEGNRLGLTGYFAPRGYAVAMVDLRGTGRSGGCLDHLGQADAKDMKAVVEWLAHPDRAWSQGEWNRVGLTGHSYVGSTPSIAAAQRPRGLVTIAPSAGLASMYDHQYQYGVPYYLQWAGPQWAYEELAMGADMPPGPPDPYAGYEWGDSWDQGGPRNPDDFGCGWQNSAFTAGHGQVTGEYQAWHAQRDWRAGATAAPIPIFMIHGVNDNAARIPAAEWFFGNRFDRSGDKVWLGQHDHGSAGFTRCDEADPDVGHVNCRFEQWQFALHAWFDRHLQQRKVDTGPPVEVFLNDGTVLTASSWSEPERWLPLRPDATDMGVGTAQPEEDASASFTAVATGPSSSGTSLEFRSHALDRDHLVVGLPDLDLNASVSTSQVVNLIAVLEREDVDGERHPMTYCAIQPQLRHGMSTPAAVVPGQEMELDPQCFTMAHRIRQGERLVFSVRTSSPHHFSDWGNDAQITLYTGPGKTQLAVPVVPDPVLHADVREPAACDVTGVQEPIGADVVVPAPGVGVRVAPVTAAAYEFDVEAGNAATSIVAEPSLPADIDLYLQKQGEDGEWSDDLSSGASGSLETESLVHLCPEEGHYRVLVHNWAGPPTDVHLEITFGAAEESGGEAATGEAAADATRATPSFAASFRTHGTVARFLVTG
ncbi:MAG: CocE/NonD family hydrolase [Nitriliruptorales bacterium]